MEFLANYEEGFDESISELLTKISPTDGSYYFKEIEQEFKEYYLRKMEELSSNMIDIDFDELDVETLLMQAIKLLEQCHSTKVAYDGLREKSFQLKTELVQIKRIDDILLEREAYTDEITEGERAQIHYRKNSLKEEKAFDEVCSEIEYSKKMKEKSEEIDNEMKKFDEPRFDYANATFAIARSGALPGQYAVPKMGMLSMRGGHQVAKESMNEKLKPLEGSKNKQRVLKDYEKHAYEQEWEKREIKIKRDAIKTRIKAFTDQVGPLRFDDNMSDYQSRFRNNFFYAIRRLESIKESLNSYYNYKLDLPKVEMDDKPISLLKTSLSVQDAFNIVASTISKSTKSVFAFSVRKLATGDWESLIESKDFFFETKGNGVQLKMLRLGAELICKDSTASLSLKVTPPHGILNFRISSSFSKEITVPSRTVKLANIRPASIGREQKSGMVDCRNLFPIGRWSLQLEKNSKFELYDIKDIRIFAEISYIPEH